MPTSPILGIELMVEAQATPYIVFNEAVLALEEAATSADSDSGGAAGATLPPVVTESGTALTATGANSGNYTRFTNASAKTYSFDSAETYAVDDEYHGRNAGAGDLTLTEVGSFVINPPFGGSLVIPQGGTFTVKIVGAAEADLFGVTEAVS